MAPSYELFVRHKSKTLQREERRYFNLIRKVAKNTCALHCTALHCTALMCSTVQCDVYSVLCSRGGTNLIR